MRLLTQPNAQEAHIWSIQFANVLYVRCCNVVIYIYNMLSACNVILPTTLKWE